MLMDRAEHQMEGKMERCGKREKGGRWMWGGGDGGSDGVRERWKRKMWENDGWTDRQTEEEEGELQYFYHSEWVGSIKSRLLSADKERLRHTHTHTHTHTYHLHFSSAEAAATCVCMNVCVWRECEPGACSVSHRLVPTWKYQVDRLNGSRASLPSTAPRQGSASDGI